MLPKRIKRDLFYLGLIQCEVGRREADDLHETLRKLAYSNILKILPSKHENFQTKIVIVFHISSQNIDCGYSLEPPIKVGFNGVKII